MPELAPGLEYEYDVEVDGVLLTDVGGTLPAKVLSTPGMVGLMERAATICVHPHLPDGKVTVGFEICIKHVGASFEGATVHVKATLREVADGRKCRFDVEVTEGDRTIGVGTHERRMIDAPPGARDDRPPPV